MANEHDIVVLRLYDHKNVQITKRIIKLISIIYRGISLHPDILFYGK